MNYIKTLIKFEWKKHYKLLITCILLTYGIKFISVYTNSVSITKSAEQGLNLSVLFGAFLVFYLFGTSISSETEDSTLQFLTTSSIPRKQIILGKYLSYFSMFFCYVIFTSLSITPGYLFDLDWLFLTLSGISFLIPYFICSVLYISFFSGFISLFTRTRTLSLIVSSLTGIGLAIGVYATLGPELYMVNIAIISLIFGVITLLIFNSGDLLSTKVLLKRGFFFVCLGACVFILIVLLLSFYLDTYQFPDETQQISSIAGFHNNQIWVNRSAQKSILNLNVLSKGINYFEQNQWKNYGKRHMKVVSQSPDRKNLLIQENRSLVNLYSRGTHKKYLLNEKNELKDLGEFVGNNTYHSWGINNDLVILSFPANYHSERHLKKSFSLNYYVNGELLKILPVKAYDLNTINFINSSTILVSGIFDDGNRIEQIKIFSLGDKPLPEKTINLSFNEIVQVNPSAELLIFQHLKKYYIISFQQILDGQSPQKIPFPEKYYSVDFQEICFTGTNWIGIFRTSINGKTSAAICESHNGEYKFKDLEGKFNNVFKVHFSPDGSRLAYMSTHYNFSEEFNNFLRKRSIIRDNIPNFIKSYLWELFNKNSDCEYEIFIWNQSTDKPVSIKKLSKVNGLFLQNLYWIDNNTLAYSNGNQLNTIK